MIERWKWRVAARLHNLHEQTPIPFGVRNALFGDYSVPDPPETPQVWIASQSLVMVVKGPWKADILQPPRKVQSLQEWDTSFWRDPEEFAYLAAWAEKQPGWLSWRVNWDGLITQTHPVIWVRAFGALVATVRAEPKTAVLEVIGGGRYPLSSPDPNAPPQVGCPDGRAAYWEDSLVALLVGHEVNGERPDPNAWAPILSAAGDLLGRKKDH